MVPARGAGRYLATLEEGHPEPPQDEVVGERAARAPAAHDHDVERLSGKSRDGHVLRSAPGSGCPGSRDGTPGNGMGG